MPADADALVAFHGGLSRAPATCATSRPTRASRERDLYRFTHVDHHDRVALVAELGGEIIAVGRYERRRRPAPDAAAEVAFVVADAHQGRGIGSVLLEHLAAAGRERGVERFDAVVLAENSAMMRVFRDAGYETTRHLEYGEVTLEFDDRRDRGDRGGDARARAAGRGPLDRTGCCTPRSVAVVGASNDAGKIGHAVLRQPAAERLRRPAVPGQPARPGTSVGVPAYRSVLDVPDDIDLAVVAVPAADGARRRRAVRAARRARRWS